MDKPFDPTLESDMKELMKEVPPPIRAFFASGKVETVAKDLMRKNQLHVDQGAIVEREIILLLLGLKDPTEFTQALAAEAELDQKTIDGIVQDVNDQIFAPLREEMRRGETSTPEPAKPVAPPVPPRHIINKIMMPTVNNEKLLEDHEEPRIEFAQVPMMPPISRPALISSPPLSMTLPPPPRPVTFPPNLPGAQRPSESFGGGGGMPPAPPPRPVAPVRPYSSDPYREPINEK